VTAPVQTPPLAPEVDTRPVVIRVDHVYKRYAANEYRPSLRHELVNSVKRVFRIAAPKQVSTPFYALQDIDFTIRQGEAVGIVGRNGSGKTTLLRLMSGITKPSSGEIEINGRFAALIALSAGFNMEMSGRKNIYLNAAIQGLQPQDVRPLEDAIIDFAELGSFIDLPVKRYSSGMVARLGFSVAIHILPDIVFLDEVLAVGDEAFAAKCSERITGLREQGRTIVMVSHSASAVRKLCTRAIWIDKGIQKIDGNPDEVLQAYAASFAEVPAQESVLKLRR
jgi:ABC-type polysaccharide/polyol phosphate transport system ATPase subunit